MRSYLQTGPDDPRRFTASRPIGGLAAVPGVVTRTRSPGVRGDGASFRLVRSPARRRWPVAVSDNRGPCHGFAVAHAIGSLSAGTNPRGSSSTRRTRIRASTDADGNHRSPLSPIVAAAFAIRRPGARPPVSRRQWNVLHRPSHRTPTRAATRIRNRRQSRLRLMAIRQTRADVLR